MKKLFLCFILILTCFFTFISCNLAKNSTGDSSSATKPEINMEEVLKDYVPSESTVEFLNKNLEKVNLTPTFDVEKYTNTAEGVLTPYNIFTDGMCLQRDSVIRIFGTAPVATKKVAVSFRGRVYYGVAGGGEWEVYLPKMTAGGPFEMQIISNIGRISINDVYVGEVYLLSGQSNMEFTSYWNSSKISDLYSDPVACKNDRIRLMNAQQKREVGEPSSPVKFERVIKWEGAESKTIRAFSAVGYIFGREMEKQLDCPIGLVCNAMGGSLIEYWMSEKAYSEYRVNNSSYIDKSNDVLTNCLGFNGSINPLQGYSFRGVVWYQGESNVNGHQKYYANALRILMKDWREFFDNENLTFTLCELARFNQDPLGYSTINEKINEVAKEDNLVAVAINVDCGDWNDIHPADKHDIGNRAASETLRLFFGKDLNTAPVIQSVERVDGKTVKIILNENVVLKNGTNGFEIKTSLGWEYNLNVTVEGNVLTIRAEKDFSHIRYGYRIQVTNEIREDVSKFVTIFDEEGYPMDIFLIEA